MLEYNSIFITGASSGIGAALALSYAKPSVALWLCGRDLVRLSSVAEACRAQGAAVETKQIDVAVQADMERWIEACDAQAALDLVIANAGVSLGPTARSIEDLQILKRGRRPRPPCRWVRSPLFRPAADLFSLRVQNPVDLSRRGLPV